ncbi:MAG: hypothetical protein Q9224_006086 [Gallowayella concinna]
MVEGYTSEVDAIRSDIPKTVDNNVITVLEKAPVGFMGSHVNPQPSKDPNDPLNWAQSKKNLTLLIISATAFLADYGSATGAVTLIPQAKYAFIISIECLADRSAEIGAYPRIR